MKIFTSFLLCFVLLTSSAQNFQWVKNIGGSGEDNTYSIATDEFGFVYIAGSFSSTVDFDPSSGLMELTSNGLTDAFVAKYNSEGELIWGRAIGASGYDNGFDVDVDHNGHVLLTGSFNGSVDFNPGPEVEIMSSNGDHDAFILKLNGSGDYVWAYTIGGGGMDRGALTETDSTGNVFFVGEFLGDFVDLDPTGGTSFFSADWNNVFVIKLDENGLFSWATALQSYEGDTRATDLVVDQIGNSYLTGFYFGTAGITGTSSVTVAGNNEFDDCFILKIAPSGQAVWLESVGGNESDRGTSIFLSNAGHLYLGGTFNGVADVDPSDEILNLTSGGASDAFLMKMDTLGSLMWVNQLEGFSLETIASFVELPNENILCNGQFGGMVDFDPGSNQVNLFVPGWGSAEFFWTLTPEGGYVDAKMLSATGKMVLSSEGSVFTSAGYIGTPSFNPDNLSSDFLSNPNDYNIFLTKYDLDGCLPSFGTDVQSACGDFVWIDGNTYTESTNEPTWIVMNEYGCDSTITLQLTITNLSSAVNITSEALIADEANANYQWLDCLDDMQPISNESAQSYIPMQTGEYAVIISANGCEATSECFEFAVTNVYETDNQNALFVYPNPSRDIFYVSVPPGSIEQVRCIDVNGRPINVEFFFNSNQLYFNLSEQPDGAYYLQVQTNRANWYSAIFKF